MPDEVKGGNHQLRVTLEEVSQRYKVSTNLDNCDSVD